MAHSDICCGYFQGPIYLKEKTPENDQPLLEVGNADLTISQEITEIEQPSRIRRGGVECKVAYTNSVNLDMVLHCINPRNLALAFLGDVENLSGSITGEAHKVNAMHELIAFNFVPDKSTIVVESSGDAATLTEQDIDFTAVQPGIGGNSITIELADTATAGAETVSVAGNAITIGIESGVSTATQVLAAINASDAALELVTAVISGTGSNPQTSAGPTNLAGGGANQVSYVEGTDYVVTNAGIKIIDGSSIPVNGSFISVDYDYTNNIRVNMQTVSQKEYYLVFDGENIGEEGNRAVVFKAFRVKFNPTEEFIILSDAEEFSSLEVSAEVLRDSSITSGSQYMDWTYGELTA